MIDLSQAIMRGVTPPPQLSFSESSWAEQDDVKISSRASPQTSGGDLASNDAIASRRSCLVLGMESMIAVVMRHHWPLHARFGLPLYKAQSRFDVRLACNQIINVYRARSTKDTASREPRDTCLIRKFFNERQSKNDELLFFGSEP